MIWLLKFTLFMSSLQKDYSACPALVLDGCAFLLSAGFEWRESSLTFVVVGVDVQNRTQESTLSTFSKPNAKTNIYRSSSFHSLS